VRLLGAVLAGGRSRRFGCDKAMELVAGVPMLHRAVHVLTAVAQEVVVISCNETEVPQGIRVLPDVRPGLGPMGGLHTALLEAEACNSHAVLLLACDLPLVSERVIAAIATQAEASIASLAESSSAPFAGASLTPAAERPIAPLGEGSLAVAPTRDGGVEPLCAVYGLGALPVLVELLDGPDLSLHSLFRALNGRALDLASLGLETDASFLNVNTPEELLRARSYPGPE